VEVDRDMPKGGVVREVEKMPAWILAGSYGIEQSVRFEGCLNRWEERTSSS